MSNRTERAVGYCDVVSCTDYARGVFLLGARSASFYCPACRQPGTIVREHGSTEHAELGEHYSQAIVEFRLCHTTGRYRGLVVVTDQSVLPGRTYRLRSPLITTDQHATKVAEGLMSTLQHARPKDGPPPPSLETLIRLDQPLAQVRVQLADLQRALSRSALRRPA